MADSTACVRYGIIMAGGSGERFWPVSRKNRPKQLLRLTSATQSMIEESVARLAPLIPPQRIYVVTGEHLVQPIRDARIGIDDINIIAEPCKRNTAGCLLYAAAHLLAATGSEPGRMSMAVVTADHQIGEPDLFRGSVAAALDSAEKDGLLVTHGIVPSRPDAGYGYIQSAGGGTVTKGMTIFPVAAFHEKPDLSTAQGYLEQGGFFWNSGMFFWRVDTLLDEMAKAQPTMTQCTLDMVAAMKRGDAAGVRTLFESLPDLSIDYALMEKTKRAAVLRAEYPWDDVGAWPSLDRTREPDAHGNVVHGSPILVDCDNCIVYNDGGAVAVGVVGMKDVVVVVSGDGVLVLPKDRAQDVRAIVAELKARNAPQL